MKKLFLLLFILIYGTWIVSAADFGRFSVDFSSPIWSELLRPEKPETACEVVSDKKHGKILKLDKGLLTTQFFPNLGQTLVISGNIKLPDSKNMPSLVFETASMSNNINSTTDLLEGATPGKWFKFTRKLSPSNGSQFRLSLKSGDKPVYLAKLEVIQRFPAEKYTLLTGDAGFEGRLGADHWFVNGSGKDWDKLELGDHKSAEIDSEKAVFGAKCLMFNDRASSKTHRFALNGQKLLITGFMRTENVVIGKKSWEMAGIQVIGYDRNGKYLSHTDLRLLHGTNPWTFFARELNFPASVRYVEVLCRIFDTAKGRAWMDEVALLRANQAGTAKKFNSQNAVIKINSQKPAATPIQPVWSGVDGLYPGWLTGTPYWKERLDGLKNAGFDYLRCRGIFAMGTYDRDDQNGNSVYNWEKADKFFDILVKQYGFKLFPTLSPTPLALRHPGEKVNWGGTWYNGAPSDYDKYGKFVEDFIEHLIQRYGAETVAQWKWEFWNEPHTTGEGNIHLIPKGEKTAPACIMYEKVLDAFDRLEKKHKIDLQLSITSGGFDCDEMILDYLKENVPEKLKRIDALSIHRYAGSCSPLTVVAEDGDKLHERAEKYGLRKDTKLWCTEWNASSMVTPTMDKPFAAALVPRFVKIFLDKKFDMTTFFSENDYPFGNKRPLYCGDTGLMTRTAIPKAVYNTFVFLNRLKGGRQVPLQSSNDPIDGLAVLAPDGSLRMVISSFDEDRTRTPYSTRITVNVKAERKPEIKSFLLTDAKHGNSCALWEKLGKPSADDNNARQQLIAASKYAEINNKPAVKAVAHKNGVYSFEITMPEYSVAYLELAPGK